MAAHVAPASSRIVPKTVRLPPVSISSLVDAVWETDTPDFLRGSDFAKREDSFLALGKMW